MQIVPQIFEKKYHSELTRILHFKWKFQYFSWQGAIAPSPDPSLVDSNSSPSTKPSWSASVSHRVPARCTHAVGRRPLRSHSNDIRKLIMPWTHNKLGDRSFSAAGPRLWNDLPPGLRQPGLSFDSFRRSLKTHLFGNWSAWSTQWKSFLSTLWVVLSGQQTIKFLHRNNVY